MVEYSAEHKTDTRGSAEEQSGVRYRIAILLDLQKLDGDLGSLIVSLRSRFRVSV